MTATNTTATGAASQAPALPLRYVWIHGLLGLPLAVIGYPLAIWIPGHYAGSLGLSLAAVGTILMLARFTDVLTDPVMGEISDRYRTRWGRRKPWIALGVPVMMLGVWNLFVPAEGIGTVGFMLWLTVFFLGSTMIALPHRAWAAELSGEYNLRSQITAVRESYVVLGLMAAAAVPMVIEIMADGTAVTAVFAQLWADAAGAFRGEFGHRAPVDRATLTGPVLIGLATLVLGVLPVATVLVLRYVPEAPPAAREQVPLREGLQHLLRNGPMKRILIIAMLVVLGEASRNAVSLFFIRDIVGIPTIGAAYFFYFVMALAAIPFWLWLGRRFGKHRSFMLTLVVVALVSGANLTLGQGDYLAFFVLFLVKGFCFGGLQFLPAAMLADVVDVDTARSGGRRAGTYFAILGLAEKFAVAIGTGLALNLVGLLGFDAAGGVKGSTEVGVTALRWVYCFGPILFYGLAMRLIWTYPLTPARHARLRLRVERRQHRIAARVAAGGASRVAAAGSPQ